MTISNFKATLIMLGYRQLSMNSTSPLFDASNQQFYNSNLQLLINILGKGDVDIYTVNKNDIKLD